MLINLCLYVSFYKPLLLIVLKEINFVNVVNKMI